MDLSEENLDVNTAEYLSLRHSSHKWTVIDWLAARQDFGLHWHPALRCLDAKVSPARLASLVAWNTSRMNNMILVVGPGTPASMLGRTVREGEADESESMEEVASVDIGIPRAGSMESLGSVSDGIHSDREDQEQLDQDMDEEEQIAKDENKDSEEEREDQLSTDDSREALLPMEGQIMLRPVAEGHAQMSNDDESDDDDDDDYDSSSDETFQWQGQSTRWKKTATYHSSMRHGGCINTACWMDCPWQLSFGKHECPTQLITSGDDRLVKIWDVQDAMGMTSPLEGGWDTYAPFAHAPRPDTHAARKSWKAIYRGRTPDKVAGGVAHLATLITGHRGNVFHVTPVKHLPGKVLTCGADGTLRLSDMVAETSNIVTASGERDRFISSIMAFSHVFLTENTGLLCSEEGLHRFDLRLSSRQQDRRSLLSGVKGPFESNYCKSCAVWSPYIQRSDEDRTTHWESSYVFAGGRSADVALLDLRAVGRSRIVEMYRPRCLKDTKNVSVSGLDVSKNSRELLVSYESDQIYTFPILPWVSRNASPTLEHIEEHASSSHDVVHELAAYGGHLNRFTFLKNAKYAGPNDDFICTGSDSGCAWIYDRKTGAAVSLLGADKITCNGIVPHPSLPFFISYGIDSTAKLWRATTPVSSHADDTASGRVLCSADEPYEMSPVGRSWGNVRHLVERDATPGMLPDVVPNFCGGQSILRFDSHQMHISGPESPIFGNAIHGLPSLLRCNQFECYRQAQRRSSSRGRDIPVEQPVEDFSHRASLSRLCLQAHKMGLEFNPNAPYVFKGYESAIATKIAHPADLVPECPSDWLLFDSSMGGAKEHVHRNLNTVEFSDVLRETYEDDPFFLRTSSIHRIDLQPWFKESDLPSKEEVLQCQWIDTITDSDIFRRRQVFLATINLLKNSGNEASKQNKWIVAARHYDKALQYCAFALMKHQLSKDQFRHLSCRDPFDLKDTEASCVDPVWSPILHAFVATRLNLSLLMLRPEFSDPTNAADQAELALDYLKPFKTTEGIIPSLKAKAYFRLGSAKLELGCYSEAIRCFEACVRDSRSSPAGKQDKLVVYRLREAKRKLKRKKEKSRDNVRRALLGLGSD